MRWTGSNRKYYESILNDKGEQKYKFSGANKYFIIEAEDLSKGSHFKIKVQCDYCGRIYPKINQGYRRELENSEDGKVCCKDCVGRKVRENNKTSYDYVTDIIEPEKTGVQPKYKKEDLISEFYRYTNEFNAYPRPSDLNSNKDYPHTRHYYRFWDNWNDFLYELNVLSDDPKWYICDLDTFINMYPDERFSIKDINDSLMIKRSLKEMRDKANNLEIHRKSFYQIREYLTDTEEHKLRSSLQGLRDLYEDIGVCPTAAEYEEYAKANGLFHRKKLERKSGNRFAEICTRILNKNNKTVMSKSDLINRLIILKDKLGRVPFAYELPKYGLPEKKAYLRKFNMNYQDIIKELGWDSPSPTLHYKTEEELLSDYYTLYKKLKRLPLREDVINEENMATYDTYKKYFGELKTVWDALEIDYSKEIYNLELGKGITCLDKNGDICKSETERFITDMLIDNNIEYKKEVRYKDVFPNINKLWVMDWYLPKTNTIVEFFGLYNEKYLKVDNMTGKYTRKVMSKLNFCKEYNANIIDIYPDDVKNNYNGIANKLSSIILK